MNKEEESKKTCVSDRFQDQEFINNVCYSYRHDFGLLSKEERDGVIYQCKEWMRAINNNKFY